MTRSQRVVIRMCVGCRRRRPTSELIRLAAYDGDVCLRVGYGRGAWLCSDSRRCAEETFRGGRLSKALRIPIPPARLARLKDSFGV
ncbi:DUF448 domain-containing protein [Ferrimicrobium sp.]|uniref:YlxR family protein n=1 Tax=Ferrimicrobium sp. TaxID=2926050 RepID=UPI00344D17D5